jgi:hypothetical protein
MHRFVIFTLIILPFLSAGSVFALTKSTAKVPSTPFDVAVWIPYWRKTDGASSTLANLDKVTQISPFSFELQRDGSIKNALKVEEEPWTTLIAEAKKEKSENIPKYSFLSNNLRR